jgi:hypothetical protein
VLELLPHELGVALVTDVALNEDPPSDGTSVGVVVSPEVAERRGVRSDRGCSNLGSTP